MKNIDQLAEGRGANGKKSDAINPHRVQASISDNHSAPANRPHHKPHPTPKPTDTMPGCLLEPILQGGTDAHEEKESGNSAGLHSLSESPHPEIVQCSRQRERTQERSGP